MDVGTVVTQTALLVQRMLGERIKLVLDVQETCPIVADAGQVEQVILNLAANARDAMPNGGTLRVTCRTHAEVVALDVTDTGQGMSEATKQRLFEPFFTTKPVGQGTGLGLSTVHGIVASSSGTIEVTSTLGEGTRFSIRWPRTALPTADLSAPTPTPHSAGDGRLVFVVEDNDAARAFMKRLLERRGFAVQVARDGDEATALLKARQSPPDLLLTDVIMPGITGPQLVRNTLERWPNLRFLFVSGYLGDEAESFGFDPVHDLLTKPFTADALLTRIATKLDDRTERASNPSAEASISVAVNTRSGGSA
jgi:CheY-like chemotaxis protein